MHKLIMLSSVYQMSAQASGLALEKDAGNDLFSRFNMRRLTAEEVRDSILAVNGSLNLSSIGLLPSLLLVVGGIVWWRCRRS